MPYIIGITPTYYRLTQKLDLVTLCQTLMNVPNFIWIVVEDSNRKTAQVTSILTRCPVVSVQLTARTTAESRKIHMKGSEQRNKGLEWIRQQCMRCGDDPGACDGVVYFMDDDNAYDLRLFDVVWDTLELSIKASSQYHSWNVT